ncbi:hypothetical protein Pst134EB_003574 [Puccinia striiformis f. sp. tritici]|nr:hypothetical protein Pst134EB_003574 [Puccinia striiformis f. sp. tritici]
MATMLHHGSASSTWSSESSELPVTPTLSATIDNETLQPTPQVSHETSRLLSAVPFLNATTISLSKSETNIADLVKPTGAISPILRPSPSLSTIHQKLERVEQKDSTSFGPHGRRRSNSLSERDRPSIDKSDSKVPPLAERRRSETSRYLGTDDFKSAFATNLLKLKEREKVEGDPAVQSSDIVLKTSEVGGNLAPIAQPKDSSGVAPLMGSNSRTAKSDQPDPGNPAVPVPESHGEPSRKAYNAAQISSTVGHLMNLPAEEISTQLDKHFSQLKSDRMEDELEARNEVITILAHQMSNQLEVNDKLLHELAALRAAYASLQSSCSDYVDELEFLKIRFRAAETEREMERARRVSEDKARGLGQLVNDSKKAFCRLQAEVLHHDKRRSLQNYHLEPRRNSSFILAGEVGTSSTSTRRNSSYILGSETPGMLHTEVNRSTSLVLSSENPQKINGKSQGGLTSLSEPVYEGDKYNSFGRMIPAAGLMNIKPERPPRSAARTDLTSPASIQFQKNLALNSIVVTPGTNCVSQTSDHTNIDEIEQLRQRCARLELELNESEDSRMASQDALDALKNFISIQPQSDLSTIKLPPLPTDMQPEDNHDEANSGGWNITNLITRSYPSKPIGTGPPSPYLKSPSIHGSPAFGNAFGGFSSLWGRSPVLG